MSEQRGCYSGRRASHMWIWLCVPVLVQAQDAGPEEVVVTAQRRATSLISAPASVAVVTADEIEASGVTRPADLVSYVPNFSITTANRAGEAFVSVRGLAQARSADSIVAVIVDGVQLASAEELNQELFDISQIEVLKGPQGALYGRNAIGGAIVIKTREPSDELEATASVGFGNISSSKAVGTVNIPLAADAAYLRLGAFQRSNDGFQYNSTLQRNVDPADERGVRARLDLTATENLSLSVRAAGSRFEGGGINYHAQFGEIDTDDTSAVFTANVASRDIQDKHSAAIVADWDIGSGHLILTPAYSYTHERLAADGFPYAATADTTQRAEFMVETSSVELKYESQPSGGIGYIFGGYWAQVDRRDSVTTGADTGRGFVFDGRGPFSADSINPTLALNDDDYRYDVYAVFGQAVAQLTDSIELTGAIRYDNETRRQVNMVPIAFSEYSGLVRDKTFEGIEPKVTLSYRPSSNLNIYADYSQGFVSGGFNPAQTRDRVTAADPAATIQNEYGEQVSRATELGVKANLLGRRLSLEAAVFHTIVTNLQQFQFFPAATLQAINPIDESTIDGVDVAATLRQGGLSLSLGGGYTDARISEFRGNPAYVDNRNPYVPEYTLSVSAGYDTTLGSGLDGGMRVGAQRTGPQWFDIANTPGTRRSAVDLVDLRVNVGGDAWTLSAFAKNLFDEKYNAEAIVILPVAQVVTPAMGRTYGVEFKMKLD